MSTPIVVARCRCLVLFIGLTAMVRPLHAQRRPTFEHAVVAGGDWLQANALPLDRDAMQSVAGNLSLRNGAWALDGGWLRIARNLSTVQGGTISIGRLVPLGPVLLIPAVSGFGGRAQRSVDSTGFDWVDPVTGASGHTPRYTYSSAASFGGGAGITLEVPIYRMIAARAVASQWYFSGTPLDGDRARTVVGAGLSVRLHGGR